jgi:POT family proton-dependent oligopeptide transporter
MQLSLEAGTVLSITTQILPYLILTMAEVLVSATGLEFAYSQAPLRMKSALMSFWSLSVTVGNLWVLLVNLGVRRPEVGDFAASVGMGVTSFQMYFFALFALVAASLFGLYARSFPVVDRYRAA